MGASKTRFDVQLVFPDCVVGIQNSPHRTYTPEQVCDALDDFVKRIRATMIKPLPLIETLDLTDDQQT